MKECKRERRPLGNLGLQRYVHNTLPASRGVIPANHYQDEFDFRGFLDGSLGELPPRPKPAFMSGEEKRRLLDVR